MKRLPLMRALLTLLVGFVVLTTATAQTSTDPNEGSRLTYDSLLGSYDFSWWGQPGRTYFLQHSDDLLTWEYLPLIESGTDGLLSWSFTSTASKFFLRLRFSDIPTSDPFGADFDGDKVSNYDELLFGTDPLVSTDSDLDGLPDDWEKAYFGNLDSSAADDPDNDGLSNLEEFMHGTNPNSPDSDFDGLSDGDEVNIHGTDPLKWDSDGDTLPDGWEVQYGLNPLDPADAAQTAAGGGMSNLQHYEMGSNPNEPPPPPTITAGTATFDLNADTPLFPAAGSQIAAAGSQPLLINGDFSAPSLGDSDWDTYPGIPGWTAISGSLIEIQQREVNTTANAGQYCELDSHWPTDDHSGPSDHGIQQTVNLTRGQYVLVFDYRGRGPGADRFTVRAQVGSTSPATLPVELAAKNDAATTWNRAVTTFEVTGGNPNLAAVPITLRFDIADAADSYGAYIDNVILLPLEVRAFQDEDGPHGSPPMYAPPRPDDGQPFGDLLSLWPAEKATFGIGEPIAGMLQRNELPAGTVKWTGDDLIEKTDVATFDVQWWTPGLKHVNLQIGATIYHLYVNIPDTGSLDFTPPGLTPGSNQALKNAIGRIEYGKILAAGGVVRDWVRNRYGQDGATGGTRQDAIRHSSWNAVSAEQVGKAKTIVFSTANEFHGQYFTAGFASNCTMDLHNNEAGAIAGDAYLNATPLKTANELIDAMEVKFNAGELWVWTPPNANVNQHSHILKKSNRNKIFAP